MARVSDKTLELDELTRELRAKLKIDNPAQLVEAVNCPPEMAAAMITGRPELLRLVQPRALTEEEARSLYKMIAVLIETNHALQQHANELAKLVKNWSDAFVQLRSVGDKIQRFANFETLGAGDDDATEH